MTAIASARRPIARVGMLLFLAADAMGFAALLFAYARLRYYAASWPAHQKLGLGFTGVMTLVLMASSFTMLRAVATARANQTRPTRAWLGATMLGGLLFLGGQAREWTTLVRDKGMGLDVDQLSATFFVTTGYHGAHVLAGVVLLGLIAAAKNLRAVAIAGLYWQFVDAVWLLIFTLVYVV